MLILLKMSLPKTKNIIDVPVGTPVYNQQNQLLDINFIQQDQLLLLPSN